MWSHREFAATVPMGQLAARNQDTVLGHLWNFLNPMLLVGVYYFIFQVVLGVEERRGVDNYLPFLTVGVLSYNYTRACIHGGALSLVTNRALIQSLHFPRAILPISATIAQSVAHGYTTVAMALLLIPMGIRPSWRWLLLPAVLILQGLLNLGLSLFAARFTFHFRDFEKFLPYLLRLGFYGSGILIPLVPEFIENQTLLTILQLNPVFMVVDVTRQVMLGTPPHWPFVWGCVAWAVALITLGFAYFRRAEDLYANV